jgi:hypothetical protein
MNIMHSTVVPTFTHKNKSTIFRTLGLGALLFTLFLVAGTANAFMSPSFWCEQQIDNKGMCIGNMSGVRANPMNWLALNTGSDGRLHLGIGYNGKQYMCSFDLTQSNYFRELALMSNSDDMSFQIHFQYGKCTQAYFFRYVSQ